MNASRRYIVAVAWSPDGGYLAAVTGDNAHTVHVFKLNLHLPTPPQRIFQGPGHKGEPPQVFGIAWNPFKRCMNPQTRAVTPGALEFVTFGVKHLKFWRYDPALDTYTSCAPPLVDTSCLGAQWQLSLERMHVISGGHGARFCLMLLTSSLLCGLL